jgi:hypothetical protein
MSIAKSELPDIELYSDEATAVAGLTTRAGACPAGSPPLPAWATAPEVEDSQGVTLLRPDDAVIRDEGVRRGLMYRDLVRFHGRSRLVLNLEGISPFGHPFHDDIFAVLHELGLVGGRLAICGAGAWYTERLQLYEPLIRVVVESSSAGQRKAE